MTEVILTITGVTVEARVESLVISDSVETVMYELVVEEQGVG